MAAHSFKLGKTAPRKTILATQFLVLCFLSSCVTEQPRNAVPPGFDELAEVVNMPGVRIWGDGNNGALHADIIQSISDEPDGLFSRRPDGEFQYSMFGISSGAQERYDPVGMRRMFDIGYTIGKDPNFWQTVPPGFRDWPDRMAQLGWWHHSGRVGAPCVQRGRPTSCTNGIVRNSVSCLPPHMSTVI